MQIEAGARLRKAWEHKGNPPCGRKGILTWGGHGG